MPLDTILRRGVKIAHKVTRSIQGTVSFSPWIGQDVYGNETFGATQPVLTVIDQEFKRKMLPTGQIVPVKATLTFLVKTTPAINPKDRIVLPDGTTGPIVFSGGVQDPDTQRPFAVEVWLGS